LGLDPLPAFIHVNKAIDKILLLASIETVDDYPVHERQLAALAAVNPTLDQISPLPKKRKCYIAMMDVPAFSFGILYPSYHQPIATIILYMFNEQPNNIRIKY
jgi:hypothetical protein